MSTQSINSLLADAAEKIKREAYAAGWRDAIVALNKSVSELVDPATLENIEIQEAVNAPVVLGPSNSKLPKQGSTPWAIVQAVKKQPGMTATQIVETLKENGHNAPESSIRTSIFRMKNKKLIVPRHNKWFPA
jgi:hypothetical protein